MSYITPVVPSKRIAAAAAALLLGTTAALVVLEVVVRLAGIAPPLPAQYGDNVRDDVIGYVRRPGSTHEGRSESGEFTFHHQHNALGFRDRDHRERKAADTVRIVALGDSFTYGIGADFEDTYLARVEQQLNQRPGPHRPVEIIKLGLPRQFPLVERLTLERYGLRFAPDIVMVAVLPNDIVDSVKGLGSACVSTSGYLVPCAALAWGEAAVWASLRSAVARLVLQRWGSNGAPAVDAVSWEQILADDGRYESGWRAIEQELGRMQDRARQQGATFVVVALPQRPPWRDVDAYPEARLGRWSTAHGAVFVPTLAALRAASAARTLYWKRDGHCTPAGYAVIADAVATGLIEHGLTP